MFHVKHWCLETRHSTLGTSPRAGRLRTRATCQFWSSGRIGSGKNSMPSSLQRLASSARGLAVDAARRHSPRSGSCGLPRRSARRRIPTSPRPRPAACAWRRRVPRARQRAASRAWPRLRVRLPRASSLPRLRLPRLAMPAPSAPLHLAACRTCGQDSWPRLACRSKAVLLANQPSNSWPFLHLSR